MDIKRNTLINKNTQYSLNRDKITFNNFHKKFIGYIINKLFNSCHLAS